MKQQSLIVFLLTLATLVNPAKVVFGQTTTCDKNGFFGAIKKGDSARVQTELKRGCTVNTFQYDDSKDTPLHVAALNGKDEIAAILLKKGALVDARDSFGWTPMFDAAKFGHLKVVKLLVESKADLFARDNLERSPEMTQVCSVKMGQSGRESRRAGIAAAS